MGRRLIMESFAQGLWTDTAALADESDWRPWVARALLGCSRPEDGPEPPGEKSAERDFFRATAHWMAGREDDALSILHGLTTPPARRLAALIAKPKIRVLTQWFSTGQPPHLLHSGAKSDPKFEISNLGFFPGDRPYDVDAEAGALFDPAAPPDFFLTVMAEWHVPPPGLFDLPCPIFAHTGDVDLHHQAVAAKMRGFDEVAVTDGTEGQDFGAILPNPVITFPKVFALAERLLPPLPAPDQERDIDLLMTGTVLHPYHPDKARLFHQVQGRASVHKALFVNGFLPGERYFDLLGRARLSLSHVRHIGAIPTRALESLAMGCPVLVPEGSALWLYLNAEDGMIPYRVAEGPGRAIDDALANFDLWRARAARGASKVRTLFEEKLAASQYLRFFTVRAALASPSPHRQEAKRAWAKRPIVSQGRLSVSPAQAAEISRARCDRWALEMNAAFDPRKANDLAREMLLTHAAALQGLGGKHPWDNLPTSALGWLKRAMEADPTALVPRFNFVRAALHFGDESQRQAGLALAAEVLSQPAEHWRCGPEDDVLSHDFFPEFFNARGFNDVLVSHAGQTSLEDAARKLILASLHAYQGRFTRERSAFAAAVNLDPEFAFYRLDLAKACLRQGDGRAALDHLARLAEDSLVAAQALDLMIKVLTAGGGDPVPAKAASNRFHRSFLDLEEGSIRYCSPYHDARALNDGPSVQAGRRPVAHPRVSLLVPRRPGQAGLDALRALASAEVPPDVEVVMVEPFDLPTPGTAPLCARIVAAHQSERIAHLGHALNLALSTTQAPRIAVLDIQDGEPLPDLSILSGGGEAMAFSTASGASPKAVLDALCRTPSLVVLPRAEVIAAGGFDEHGIFGGVLGGSYELVRRLMNRGAGSAMDWTPPLETLMGVSGGPGWDILKDIWKGLLDRSPTEPLKRTRSL